MGEIPGPLSDHPQSDIGQVAGMVAIAGAHEDREEISRADVDRLGDEVEGPRVLDVGSGSSADLRLYDRVGCKAIGYDYAHPGKHALGGKEIDLPASVGRRVLNLLDERDVLTVGALAARQKGDKVVTARRLLEAVPPRSRAQLWRFASMALASGGRVYVEGVSRSPEQDRKSTRLNSSPRT